MLLELNRIIIFGLVAFFIAIIAYPYYIKLLTYLKVKKQIREDDMMGKKAEIFANLHKHKSGTPTMGGGIFLIILLIMIGVSFIIQYYKITTNSLVEQGETYIILFAIFSMGFLGVVDDYFNIKGKGKVKGLSAKAKLAGMIGFAAFISLWFYIKLDAHSLNLRPLGSFEDVGILYPLISFFFTISIVNAINITDGLDGLVGGLLIIVLSVFAIVTFSENQYLATTVIGIVLAVLMAFLWFNINPAKIFMGDSGALALGGLVASLVRLLNFKVGIIIPFIILFGIFRVEIGSSFLQIVRKKLFKKKLFPIAPFHHYLEHKGMQETTIVMKLWLIQGVLAAIASILIFYQIHR